jgi:hypothetical protein
MFPIFRRVIVPVTSGLLLAGLDPEDEGIILLRTVGNYLPVDIA